MPSTQDEQVGEEVQLLGGGDISAKAQSAGTLEREEIGGNSQSKDLAVGRKSPSELSAGLEAIVIQSSAFLMLSLKCIERAYGIS